MSLTKLITRLLGVATRKEVAQLRDDVSALRVEIIKEQARRQGFDAKMQRREILEANPYRNSPDMGDAWSSGWNSAISLTTHIDGFYLTYGNLSREMRELAAWQEGLEALVLEGQDATQNPHPQPEDGEADTAKAWDMGWDSAKVILTRIQALLQSCVAVQDRMKVLDSVQGKLDELEYRVKCLSRLGEPQGSAGRGSVGGWGGGSWATARGGGGGVAVEPKLTHKLRLEDVVSFNRKIQAEIDEVSISVGSEVSFNTYPAPSGKIYRICFSAQKENRNELMGEVWVLVDGEYLVVTSEDKRGRRLYGELKDAVAILLK